MASLGAIPLMQMQFPASSDGIFHLYRLWELDQLWQQGVVLPRWAPDFYFGYGYPIFQYTPLLPYAVAELLHLVGLSLIGAFKAMLALGLPASALAAYGLARQLFSRWSACIAGIAYALAPYHLVNLYGRADLPEYLAAIWLPLILWSVIAVYRKPSIAAVLGLATSISGLLLTHNLSALMFAPVVAAFVIVAIVCARPEARWRLIACLSGGGALGAACAAFFWLPALAERNDVQFGRLLHSYAYQAHFAELSQLLSTDPVQQYAPVFAFARRYGYQFGFWQSISVVGGIVALPFLWPRRDSVGRALLAGAPLVCVASLVMTMSISSLAWDHVPLLALAQFPWRYLGMAALPAALGVAAIVELARDAWRIVPTLLMSGLVAASSLLGLAPIDLRLPNAVLTPAGYARFELQERLIGTSAAGEYLPTTVRERAETSAEALSLATGLSAPTGPALPLPRDGAAGLTRLYHLDLTAPAKVLLDTLDFPGWRVLVDGRPVTSTADPTSGLITAEVPVGTHVVSAEMRETPLRVAADVLSLATLIVVVGLGARGVLPRRRSVTGFPIFRIGIAAAGLAALALLAAAPHDTQVGLTNVTFDRGITVSSVFLPQATDGVVTATGPASITTSISWRLPIGTNERIVPYSRLTTSDGQIWASAVGAQLPDGGAATTDLDLEVPIDTPPGVYTLEAGLAQLDDDGSAFVLPLGSIGSTSLLPLGNAPPVATVVLRRSKEVPPTVAVTSFGRTIETGPVSLAVQPGANSAAAFIPPRCSSSGSLPAVCLVAGQSIVVTVPWHDVSAHRRRVTAALHLTDAAGTLWASSDAEPAGGRYPSTFWQSGETVRDDRTLVVPTYIPPGRYRISLEASLDGQQLSVLDAGGNPAGIGDVLADVSVAPARQAASLGTEDAPVQLSPDRQAGFGIMLRGVSALPPRLHPGDELQLGELWVASASSRPDVALQLALVGSDHAARVLSDGPPIATYPSSQWKAGVPLLAQQSARLAADQKPGTYQVIAAISRDGTAGPSLALGQVDVVALPQGAEVQPKQAVDAFFGDEVRLAGFDPAPPLTWKSATTQAVVLYWQGEQPLSTAYKVSVQLLDEHGKLVAQHDSEPAEGTRPTTGWLPGVQVADRHALLLPPLPPGLYQLVVVVYNPVDGQRLRLGDGSDSLPLAAVHIGG